MEKDVHKRLYDAAKNRRWEEAVDLVVNKGATNSYRDGRGWTALYLAARDNSGCRLIKEVLNRQPDQVDVEDYGGWTPLCWAIDNNNEDCIKELMSFKPRKTILFVFGIIKGNTFRYDNGTVTDEKKRSLKTILTCDSYSITSICRNFKAICDADGYQKLLG